ncbi:MAG: OsmC family protein [Pseudomonadota bacterium]
MDKKPILSKRATVEVRKMVRNMLEKDPGLSGTTRVDVEILRNHLMKAKITMPSVGAEFTIFADEPPMIGGEGAAPLMFGYFMAGTLLCECAQYTWNAAELGLVDVIYKLEMTIEGGFPAAPLYGMDDTKGAAAVKEMKVTTRIEADASPEQIEKLARLAAARCPAHQTVVNKVPYVNIVELNGKKIAEFREP